MCATVLKTATLGLVRASPFCLLTLCFYYIKSVLFCQHCHFQNLNAKYYQQNHLSVIMIICIAINTNMEYNII